jgi:hypothetical protein
LLFMSATMWSLSISVLSTSNKKTTCSAAIAVKNLRQQ